MQLIQMPRQYGKSTTIVHLMAANDDSVCIISTHEMAERMAQWLFGRLAEVAPGKVVGKNPRHFSNRFFTPGSFKRSVLKRNTKVYVDDIDAVLSQVLGCHVDIATYSPPQQWERP